MWSLNENATIIVHVYKYCIRIVYGCEHNVRKISILFVVYILCALPVRYPKQSTRAIFFADFDWNRISVNNRLGGCGFFWRSLYGERSKFRQVIYGNRFFGAVCGIPLGSGSTAVSGCISLAPQGLSTGSLATLLAWSSTSPAGLNLCQRHYYTCYTPRLSHMYGLYHSKHNFNCAKPKNKKKPLSYLNSMGQTL